MAHNKVFRARKSYFCSSCGWSISKGEQYLRNDNPWTKKTDVYCYYCVTGKTRPSGFTLDEFLQGLNAKDELSNKIKTQKSVFLSHSHLDKAFARVLGKELNKRGILTFIDEAEIKVGASLIREISRGIDIVDYVLAILSPNSVDAPWVQHELELAMTREIEEKRIIVLPLIIEDCKPPAFLKNKLYLDFTKCITEKDRIDFIDKIVKRVNS
jgi:hypothetical protein